MMENNFEPTLDDALNTFVQENDRPTAGNLQEWVERYPQFRKDLIDFAAAWAEQLILPAAEEIGAETEKLLVDRAMSHVHNVAYSRNVEKLRQTTSDDPVHSLTEDAQRAGTKPAELARACRLDLGLLSKLNSRQIQPWTIPGRVDPHACGATEQDRRGAEDILRWATSGGSRHGIPLPGQTDNFASAELY